MKRSWAAGMILSVFFALSLGLAFAEKEMSSKDNSTKQIYTTNITKKSGNITEMPKTYLNSTNATMPNAKGNLTNPFKNARGKGPSVTPCPTGCTGPVVPNCLCSG